MSAGVLSTTEVPAEVLKLEYVEYFPMLVVPPTSCCYMFDMFERKGDVKCPHL